MTTKKVELEVYEDESGRLYQRITQRDGVKNPNAIREFVAVGDQHGVRWLLPLGYRQGSKALAEAISDSRPVAGKVGSA
jgi:hypothetical protein